MNHCKVCDYRWESHPRIGKRLPRVCPRCKRADWGDDSWKPSKRKKNANISTAKSSETKS